MFATGGATCLIGVDRSDQNASPSALQVAFAAGGDEAVEVPDADGNRSTDGEV